MYNADMAERTAVIGVRATAAEHEAWKAAAKADGRTLSSWIVRRCNGQAATAPMLSAEPPAKPKAKRKRPA